MSGEIRRKVCRHFASAEPVLVWTAGKVGSSSLFETLRRHHWPGGLYQIHFLGERLSEIRQHYAGSPPDHIWISEAVRYGLARWPGRKVRVISLVRDPVERLLSDRFQNPECYPPGSDPLVVRDQMIERIRRQPPTTTLEKWFSDDLEAVTGARILGADFDAGRGYQRYPAGRFDILILQVERLDEVGAECLREFLALSAPLELVRSNQRTDTPEAARYKQIKRSLSIPIRTVEAMAASSYMRTFYSPAQIRGFVNRWSGPSP